jgi:hypothetical protein
VAAGNYEVNDQAGTNIIMKNGISLYGGYNESDWSRDITVNQTIITDISTTGGSSADTNSAIYIDETVTKITEIDGFYINGSTAGSNYSAAIFINGGKSTISNNILKGGSGLFSYAIYVTLSNEFLEIRNNTLIGGSGNSSFGIYLYNSSPNIFNNTITGVTDSGGLNTEFSYGIIVYESSPYIRNNTINGGNPQMGTSTSYVIFLNYSFPVIENNIMFNVGGMINYGMLDQNGSTIISLKNNDIFSCTTGLFYNGVTTYTNVEDLNSLSYANGNISEDAMLDMVNDYNLTLASPLSVKEGGIDGSTKGWLYSYDKNGTQRTGNGLTGWSIGAYEHD